MNGLFCAMGYRNKALLLLGVAAVFGVVVLTVPAVIAGGKRGGKTERIVNVAAWIAGSVFLAVSCVSVYFAACGSKTVDIQGYVVDEGVDTKYPLVLTAVACVLAVTTALSSKKMYNSSSFPSGKGIWLADTCAAYLFALSGFKISWVAEMASVLVWIAFIVQACFLYVVFTAPQEPLSADAQSSKPTKYGREKWRTAAIVGGAVLLLCVLICAPFSLHAKAATGIGGIVLAILYAPQEKAAISRKICFAVGCCFLSSGVTLVIAALIADVPFFIAYWLFAVAAVALGALPKAT